MDTFKITVKIAEKFLKFLEKQWWWGANFHKSFFNKLELNKITY